MDTNGSEEKRIINLHIRLTELEKELITLKAKAANYPSVSSYVRVIAKTGLVININFNEVLPFMSAMDNIANEIHRIGINENQLAKKSNANQWTYVESNLHFEILDELKKLSEEQEKLNKLLIPFWEKLANLLERIHHGVR